MPKDVINADQDPDAVSAALGLDDAEEDTSDEGPDDTSDGDDEGDDKDPLEELRAAIAELRRDNAKLKREAAAARVASKPSTGKADQQSDAESVEQARQAGKDEARLEYGIELAGASIRAALTGIIPEADLDDYIDDLRLDRYVDEDGRPDKDAIKALKERQAKITRRKTPARTGHGRTSGTPQQKTKGQELNDALASLGF